MNGNSITFKLNSMKKETQFLNKNIELTNSPCEPKQLFIFYKYYFLTDPHKFNIKNNHI